MRNYRIVCFIFLTLTIIGCQASTPNQEDVNAEISHDLSTISSPTPTLATIPLFLISEISRDTSPNVNQEDLLELVAGNQEFAFDLYQELQETESNFLYSPYSISMMLAMIQAGAGDTTENQIGDTLHFPTGNELHSGMNALDLDLSNRAGDTGNGFHLNMTNSLWLHEDFEIKGSFSNELTTNYNTSIGLVDFVHDSEATRLIINEWVAEQTGNTIKELLTSDAVSPNTRMILLNTIYFKALWLLPFDPGNTEMETFHFLDGQEVVIPMMTQDGRFNYMSGDQFQAIELLYETGFDGLAPVSIYQDKQLSIVIFVPDIDSFEQFEESLDAEFFNKAIEEFGFYDFQVLKLPKFEFDSSLALEETLSRMGMPDAFDPMMANFSGITDSESLFVDEVLHRTYISVDELGTEASGATSAIIYETALEPAQLIIDRPFIFVIRDIETGAILFVGRVLDPRN